MHDIAKFGVALRFWEHEGFSFTFDLDMCVVSMNVIWSTFQLPNISSLEDNPFEIALNLNNSD